MKYGLCSTISRSDPKLRKWWLQTMSCSTSFPNRLRTNHGKNEYRNSAHSSTQSLHYCSYDAGSLPNEQVIY
uniref:Uncharacterized protein n=1 Tax=Arundo donax TaxID=35708 RepID=A0A0A9FUG1_ARUDO